MKRIHKLLIIVFIFLLVGVNSFAQKASTLPLTADSLATGNSKDVFKSFFQLAFDKFTSQNKELNFSSNPFAVMARMDTNLLIDKNYIKYTHLRNLNFSFSARLDSSYKFNGFASGIKYAIVNKRDETVSRAFIAQVLADTVINEYNRLNFFLGAYISTIRNTDRRNAYIEQSNKFLSGDINFSQIDKELQDTIRSKASSAHLEKFLNALQNDNALNIGELKQKGYQLLREEFQKGLLITVGVSDTTYNNQFLFSNVLANFDVLKGFGKATPGLNSELNIRAAINFVDDSLRQGRDLKRSILTFEPGLNFVFRTKNTLKSYFEFKFSGSYRHSFQNLYVGEEQDQLTFNGALRIRVFNDIWVPLEFRYEPKSGNVFGFLNIRANFTALSKFVNSNGK